MATVSGEGARKTERKTCLISPETGPEQVLVSGRRPALRALTPQLLLGTWVALPELPQGLCTEPSQQLGAAEGGPPETNNPLRNSFREEVAGSQPQD